MDWISNFKKNGECFIIAEAGVNHNGDIEIAKKLIDAAKEADVDAIKFQTFNTESLVTENTPKAAYQETLTKYKSQFDMLKALELSFEEHIILKEYCDKRGIIFLSTPFDFDSVDLLGYLDIPIYKVSSGDLVNLPLLKYIGSKNKPVILSTGMSNLGEVEQAVDCIKEIGNSSIALLQCSSSYPTSYKNVNLRAMLTMKDAFKLPVGYSDHTLGIEISLAAVSMGARIIEKHFTLNTRMEGPDHNVSLEPKELAMLVNGIRNIEMALGDGIKKCNEEERQNREVSRKSIIAKCDIKRGQYIIEDLLEFKRPEKGISVFYADAIIGKETLRDIKKGEFIYWEDLR